jgi:hypothetical protein
MASAPTAELLHHLNPLRLSYTLFADSNPLMRGVDKLAADVAACRPMEGGNPFSQMQEQGSRQISAALNAYRDARDARVRIVASFDRSVGAGPRALHPVSPGLSGETPAT